MMDNISNLTSSRKIADTLTKNVDTINHKTVGSYLDYERVMENIVTLKPLDLAVFKVIQIKGLSYGL